MLMTRSRSCGIFNYRGKLSKRIEKAEKIKNLTSSQSIIILDKYIVLDVKEP